MEELKNAEHGIDSVSVHDLYGSFYCGGNSDDWPEKTERTTQCA